MSADFWERVILAVVGPLFTAIVGTLIIGLFVQKVTREAQERRADSRREEDRIRAEHELRVRLIDQMTAAASALYIVTQHFWRNRNTEGATPEELAQLRKDLDQQYQTSRVQGEVVEKKLDAYFSSEDPRHEWHATMDLLTVRYFTLIGRATEALLEGNAGDKHSGLTVEQLRAQDEVLKAYRQRLGQAAQAVLRAPFRALPM
jgi:hypothetical protein